MCFHEWHVKVPKQLCEQHWTSVEHAWPPGKQVNAWTAVGDTIEVIKGTDTAAAIPILRTISRRDTPTACAGQTKDPSNK